MYIFSLYLITSLIRSLTCKSMALYPDIKPYIPMKVLKKVLEESLDTGKLNSLNRKKENMHRMKWSTIG